MSDDSVKQMTSNYFDANRGYYNKPHALISMLQERYLTKSEYFLMDFLLAFENRHVKDPKASWFWVGDEFIASTRVLSSKTIVKARMGLIKKGLIEVKMGYIGHRTEYKILIDKSIYFRGGDPM